MILIKKVYDPDLNRDFTYFNASKKIKQMKHTLLILISVFFLSSCAEKDVFRHSKDIDNSIWKYDDPMSASFEIIDTFVYDIYFLVNPGNYYPFENIYLRITDDFTGEAITDTVNIDLSDNYGVWKGKGSSIRKFSALLRREFRFPDTGIYNIKIEQFTRTDSLKEIEQVGILLKRSK